MNRECASNCVPTLGKVLRKPSKWFNKASGTKAWQVFQWYTQFKTGCTSVDDKHRETHKLHNSWNCCTNSKAHPSGSTSDHSWHCWGGGIWLWDMPAGSDGRTEHAPVSQPNLCPGSWQLTRSSSASMSALNFVSSPPTMKRSCLGSSLVMGAGFTVTTLRQSDNPRSGKAPHHQGQTRPDRWKAISRAWSSLSLTSRGLCAKNLSQQAELWIPGSTTKFCGDCMKKCEDIAPNFGENRPGCFTMTTPRLTLLSSPTSFWRKTKLLLSPTHHTPLIWHPV